MTKKNVKKSPGAAFRRPANGYRYFVMLLDVDTRTVQLALIHPATVTAAAQGVLPHLPAQVPRQEIDKLLALRLPGSGSTGIIH
jgi:hypothetical protein